MNKCEAALFGRYVSPRRGPLWGGDSTKGRTSLGCDHILFARGCELVPKTRRRDASKECVLWIRLQIQPSSVRVGRECADRTLISLPRRKFWPSTETLEPSARGPAKLHRFSAFFRTRDIVFQNSESCEITQILSVFFADSERIERKKKRNCFPEFRISGFCQSRRRLFFFESSSRERKKTGVFHRGPGVFFWKTAARPDGGENGRFVYFVLLHAREVVAAVAGDADVDVRACQKKNTHQKERRKRRKKRKRKRKGNSRVPPDRKREFHPPTLNLSGFTNAISRRCDGNTAAEAL